MLTELQNSINKINKKIKCLSCKIDSLSPGDSGGGGEGINIYNSDGTLTGNRTLNGANNILNFINLTTFAATFNDSGTIRKENFPFFCGIDFSGSGGQYFTRIYYRDFINSVDDTEFRLSANLIKTQNQNNDIGLKLDFANSVYQFGQITGGNTTYLSIEDSNNITRFYNAGAEIGLTFDFTNRLYAIGDYAGNFNQSLIQVDDLNGVVTLAAANPLQSIGLSLDSNNAYPLQISGTNISSGTAGAASGQFLKIKVGGVDYKIALLNP